MSEETPLLQQLADGIPEADRRFYRKTDDVAARIIQVMRTRGLSQRALANRLGKSASYVSRVLGGGVNLTLRTIAEFETALDAEVLVAPAERRPIPGRRISFTTPPETLPLPLRPETNSQTGSGVHAGPSAGGKKKPGDTHRRLQVAEPAADYDLGRDELLIAS